MCSVTRKPQQVVLPMKDVLVSCKAFDEIVLVLTDGSRSTVTYLGHYATAVHVETVGRRLLVNYSLLQAVERTGTKGVATPTARPINQQAALAELKALLPDVRRVEIKVIEAPQGDAAQAVK